MQRKAFSTTHLFQSSILKKSTGGGTTGRAGGRQEPVEQHGGQGAEGVDAQIEEGGSAAGHKQLVQLIGNSVQHRQQYGVPCRDDLRALRVAA